MATDTLGDRLRKAKKARKVSNGEIASAARVHETTVSRWMNDKSAPDARELDAAAAFLGVTSDWLRYGEDGAPAPTDLASRRSPLSRSLPETFLGVQEPRSVTYDPSVKDLPPAAYARLYEYRQRLREAGADEAQIDEAERIMVHGAYGKLNSGGHRDRTEAQLVVSIDAAWAFIWELATEGGLTIPGPKPRFRVAERES